MLGGRVVIFWGEHNDSSMFQVYHSMFFGFSNADLLQ